MRPLIKHPGGKRDVAEVIAALLGHPATVCEPFAGGLAASLVGGMKPIFSAEVIPPIRDLYNQLSNDPGAFWAGLKEYEEIADAAAYYALRKVFNGPGGATPARYAVLNASGFNGLVRFNGDGHYMTAAGKPMPCRIRRYDAEERAAYEARFEGCVCFDDWRKAVAAAVAARVPIICDPPYLDASDKAGSEADFCYGGTWGIGDLEELAETLPVGALVCERADLDGAQPGLGLVEMTAEAVLLVRGFERVHTWAARDSISAGARRARSEGIWRKVAA